MRIKQEGVVSEMKKIKGSYEVLKAAIRVKAVTWEDAAREYERDITEADDLSKLECFYYGMAVAYKQAAAELRKWL